jgi:preprotein translocase subunit SecE
MASGTRAQRRARREARREELAGAPPRPPARPTANGGGGGGGQPERRPEAHGGLRGFRFVRESWAELQKVEWPTQNQLVQGTIVVLVACIIVGLYLWLCDEAFRRLVQHVFL